MGFACIGICHATAATIPYGNVGTEAMAHTFRATSTGDFTAYYAGSTARYTNTLDVYVNGEQRGGGMFNTKSTANGAAHDFGMVHAGDILTFAINVLTTGERFSSDQSKNADGVNHVYASSFSGNAEIPVAGTFVAFEDLRGGGDLNYNDETFVFTNTAALTGPEELAAEIQNTSSRSTSNPSLPSTVVSAVPLPGSAPMFGAALLGLGAAGFGAKRRKAAAKA